MSNNNNRMIVFASILGAILATSILALNPSTITNAQAMPYGSGDYDDRHSYGDEYGYNSNYYQDDNRYSYDKKDSKSYGDIQKISCVNSNINVNGIDITQIPEDTTATAATNEGTDAANAQNGNGFDKINFDSNLVNICINVNVNDQVKVTPPPTDGTEPPTCEDCFSVLDSQQIQNLLAATQSSSIGALCISLAETPNGDVETRGLIQHFEDAQTITPQQVGGIIECLADSGVIDRPTTEFGQLCVDGIDNDRDGDIDDEDTDCPP